MVEPGFGHPVNTSIGSEGWALSRTRQGKFLAVASRKRYIPDVKERSLTKRAKWTESYGAVANTARRDQNPPGSTTRCGRFVRSHSSGEPGASCHPRTPLPARRKTTRRASSPWYQSILLPGGSSLPHFNETRDRFYPSRISTFNSCFNADLMAS